MTTDKLMTQVKLEADASQKLLLGCVMRMLSCSAKTVSEQCLHMYGIEWLEAANIALRDFFENEAEYDDHHRLVLASLKKFGQFTQGIQQTQHWVKEEESACGRCAECRTNLYRGDIVNSDPYQMLIYYEQHHKVARRGDTGGGPKDAANANLLVEPRWWNEGAD